MERFLDRHKDDIIGTLSGFDRVLFRGSLRSISYTKGMEIFLSTQHVLLKDYSSYVQGLSAQLKAQAEKFAADAGRPFLYLHSPQASKEDRARELMEQDQITEGLICVLSCVEPCQTWTVYRNRESQRLELRSQQRQCLYLYFYFADREFGLMHVRLQTWVPFTIQVCLNGREYLARQMARAGMGYQQEGNCFTRIDDLARAQQLMDRLETYPWRKYLNSLVGRVNPLLRPRAGLKPLPLKGYYWSIRQGEYATDVIFREAASLDRIYPGLLQHAIENLSSEDVLRFLGRRTNSRFAGRAESSLKKRIEGTRVKHFVEENSIKMYNKAGCLLRVETTINNPRRFRVRRTARRHGKRVTAWLPMRKGIADTQRRVAISRSANARYLNALAVVGESRPSHQLLDEVSQSVEQAGRHYRALRPVSPEDSRVCAAMMRGEFFVQGFRHQDLRQQLEAEAEQDPLERKRAAGRVTRRLRLWRAHGLIFKVVHTNYYRITKKGHEIMATALKFRQHEVALLAT
jgi:hypothetical protein